MAMAYTSANSNWFRVQDINAFEEALSIYDEEIEIINDEDSVEDDGSTLVQLFIEDGYWPTETLDEHGNVSEMNILDVIAPHLVEGSIAILREVGFERADVWASVEGINHKGVKQYCNLDVLSEQVEKELQESN